MNNYEWKQEARRQRLERAAERAKTDGERRLSTADQMAYQMNGQPILVGHHSEKRHRRQIDKMWNHSRQGFARLKEASELARRAGAVGTAGISSDDPDGADKLRAKVVSLQARRDRIKAINAYARKHGGNLDGFELIPGEAQEISANRRIWTGVYGAPYPPYVLQNLGARIRDAERRVQELGHMAERVTAGPTEATTINGVTILADPEENRVIVTFPRRLSTEEYKRARSFGFVWARTRSAFVRKLGTGGAEAIARMLAEGFKIE